ncbi:MAG: DUF4013 domain-containing protein [Candidatus Nezhaarchaeota archaeon]|nr:DUF4013 domain-containing protein [Candidatus Nezhaarchaeota archaeon]
MKRLVENLGRYAILVVLNIIPIVNFIVAGYGWRVIEETPKSDAPPQLEGFLGLWVKGLKMVVVAVIYMLIPMVLLGLGLMFMEGFPPPPFRPFVSWGLVGLGIVLAFLFFIVLSMGIAHMVKTGKLSNAFSIGRVLELIGKVGWGKYLACLVVIFALNAIAMGLGLIPYIGWIITILVSPLLLVFTTRAIAQLYHEAVKT